MVDGLVNENPPSHTNNHTISHIFHVPNSPIPKFKGTDGHFQAWKKCMWLHIKGIDGYSHTIV